MWIFSASCSCVETAPGPPGCACFASVGHFLFLLGFVLVFEVSALMCFQFLCGLSLFLLFAVLGTEPRALYMQGKCSTPEPAPGLPVFIKRLVQVVTGRQGEDGATCWVECERKDR